MRCPRSRCAAALMVVTLAMSVADVPMAAADEVAAGATSVTVFLKAPDPAALDRLAATQGLTRAQRTSALSRLVPGTPAHDQVEKALRTAGFRVTGQTSWSISATGPAARAVTLFGRRPALGSKPDTSERAAAAGALPRVPAQLTGVVAAVYPTTGGPPPFRHASTSSLDGRDFRNAGTPAHVVPSGGRNDAGATIATLQLADFYGAPNDARKSETAADLTSYANVRGLPDPVASGQYKAVKVDGGPSRMDDSNGGDVEVNLDQQSILSTAPTANQHAYFAPNTVAGFNDVFAHVYDDVVGTAHATAPDRHIVAMSVSWGQCESQTGARSIATLEPILKSLVAAGVTVFASAGDQGIYDCGSPDQTGHDNHQADVDYPASSPSVVSVGGSKLWAPTSTPNTGTNWTEKGWSCAGPVACQSDWGTGGGGGGASGSASARSDFAGFAAPAYQRVGIDDAPFKGNAKRLVPDITADGDPATGFVIHSSNPDYDSSAGVTLGGTSLAAPISAAQFTNALSDVGRKLGVGSIHGALYSAYAQTRSARTTSTKRPFRDVTTGVNGAATHKGSDPSVTAQAGYDTVSGLGGVLWSAVVPYLLDAHRPSATAVIASPKLHTEQWRQVTATWRVTRGADLRLLGPTAVRITRNGSAQPVYDRVTLPATDGLTFTAVPGRTYRVTVVGRDLGGRRSVPATATVQVPIDDTRYAVSKHWRRRAGSRDIAGSHLVSISRSAWAKVSRRGRSYRLLVHTGPTSGRLGVYLAGRRVRTLDLYTPAHRRLSKTIYTGSRARYRTFTFRPLSRKPVSIDGLYVTH